MNSELIKNNKILIIAAHPDDEILGCGGTIAKLKDNYKFKIVFMTNGVSARTKNKSEIIKRKAACLKLFKHLKLTNPTFFNFPDNEMNKISLLKIVKKIEKIIKSYKPETIFTHSPHCLNIDHRITFNAVITACRPVNKFKVKKILSFEIPSSTEWMISKGRNFEPNYYVDISKYINKKIQLIKFYKNELRKYPHSRSIKGIRAYASYRGISSGVKYAEDFYLNRFID